MSLRHFPAHEGQFTMSNDEILDPGIVPRSTGLLAHSEGNRGETAGDQAGLAAALT